MCQAARGTGALSPGSTKAAGASAAGGGEESEKEGAPRARGFFVGRIKAVGSFQQVVLLELLWLLGGAWRAGSMERREQLGLYGEVGGV